jgi:hypothetical protein
MDQGWQMSREWVDRPNQLQRCQIIADKLLSALEKENERLGMMMAGYICARLPKSTPSSSTSRARFRTPVPLSRCRPATLPSARHIAERIANSGYPDAA